MTVTVPLIRRPQRICGNTWRTWFCNRPLGHTGRHMFSRRHVQPGLVRAIWGHPEPTPRPREVPC